MKHLFQSTSKIFYLFFIYFLMMPLGALGGEGSSVTINANSISAVATVPGVSVIELRIVGPDGFYAAEQSNTGAVDWYPGYLPDGEYRFEVFVTVGEENNEGESDLTQLYRENGRFQIDGGTLSPIKRQLLQPNTDAQSAVESNGWMNQMARVLFDFLVPVAQAADLTVSSESAYLHFIDTTTANGIQWTLIGDDTDFALWNREANGTTVTQLPLVIDDDTPFRLDFSPGEIWLFNDNTDEFQFVISASAGQDVFHADANGDIEFANGALFIDKSLNNVGIGTVAPINDLHIADTTPTIVLEDTDGAMWFLNAMLGHQFFDIAYNSGSGTFRPFVIESETVDNMLYLDSTGNTGIHTNGPTTPLHIESVDGKSAKLLVRNPIAPTAAGDVNMFALENTGDKIARFAINAGGSTWTFDNEPTFNGWAGVNSGRFRIAKAGTGVAEFTVDGYGHGRFYGNSYAVNHINTSSREAKTDFHALNEHDVLEKLMQLPIEEWRYKQESTATRHIGPVAEDFKKVFGLGDGKHISTVDSEGVALAAIKAIKAEKDSEIAKKDAEIAELSKRIKALEELLIRREMVSIR